jgi:glycosyltransferase involved in cell wall biosynthesis
MRVAMVSEHASPLAAIGGVDSGGQNVHVAGLAAAMTDLGVEVVVHTRREEPHSAGEVRARPGYLVHHVDAGPAREVPKDELLPYMDDFAEDLASYWARWRPDVVHAHFWMSGYAALTAAESAAVDVVQTFHALGSVKRRHQGSRDTSPVGRGPVEEWIVRRAARIVATCRDEVKELRSLGANPRRVSVVPCGTDLGHFHPDGPAEATERPRIVVIGRMVERKGVDDAIRAMAHVDEADLVVAGGPDVSRLRQDPEARRLMALAHELGLAERVSFRGRVPRPAVPALLRSAAIVVSVPWYEPFGIVPLEAAACGVPVVASAVGGHLDTVVHGETGQLVPARDPAAVSDALRLLLGDPARRRAMGATAARRARARYGWHQVAEDTLAAYARCERAGDAAAWAVAG